jgi:hypothetical protein
MNRSRFFGPWPLVAFGLSCLLAWGEVQAGGKAGKPPASGAKAAANPSDWKVLGAGAQVKSGTKYTLRNVTDNNSLRYGKRAAGINLVWDKKTTLDNITFKREGGGAALNYGDKVAIHPTFRGTAVGILVESSGQHSFAG